MPNGIKININLFMMIIVAASSVLYVAIFKMTLKPEQITALIISLGMASGLVYWVINKR